MNSFRKKPIVTYGLIAVNLLVFIENSKCCLPRHLLNIRLKNAICRIAVLAVLPENTMSIDLRPNAIVANRFQSLAISSIILRERFSWRRYMMFNSFWSILGSFCTPRKYNVNRFKAKCSNPIWINIGVNKRQSSPWMIKGSNKNKRNNPDRLELKKYCPRDHKVTLHRETK